MRIPKDLVPQKAVAQDLCVSLVTLWRARQSGIADFPEPVVHRKMIFWRKSDVQQLEDALMRFEGRGKFEDERARVKRNADLQSARAKVRSSPRSRPQVDGKQMDLF